MTSNNGFVNLLKPPGITSHDAVNRLRRIFNTRAVGHAGTLDPAASGVLPLAIGKATRLLEYLVAADKTYTAEITFGIATDTLDQEGEIIWRSETPPIISQSDLQVVLDAMLGAQMQIPPAYAAIKLRGRPLYSYARAGEEITMPARPIVIDALSVIEFESGSIPKLLLRIKCSKGTYVRSLARDIAAKLGTRGTLTFLLREDVGKFNINESFTLEEITRLVEDGKAKDCLLPPITALQHVAKIVLDKQTAERFLHGQRIRLVAKPKDGLVAVLYAGLLLGVGNVEQGCLSPRKVLANREELAGHDQDTTI